MPNTGDIVRASDFDELKPQISIGTVTTGEAGTDASATITGTSPNFVLNMAIPKGDTGETGPQGPQGPSGVYTGPLKPTNAYWRSAAITNTSAGLINISVPSGGTWAVCCENYPLKGIRSGGTRLLTNVSDVMRDRVLCWRIQ